MPPNENFDLPIAQFVEMEGIAEPPLVENWIEKLNSIFEYLERNLKAASKLQGNKKGKVASNSLNINLRQYRLIIDMLIDYVNFNRKDPGKQYVRITLEKQSFKIWCGLLPDYIVVPIKSALPAKVQVLGRIDHFVKEGETEKIVDLSMFQQQAQLNGLLEILNNLSRQMGQTGSISESDLEARYPDIFVEPVAIYK